MRRVLAAGTLYFALVFGAGFVLGTLRVLLVVPRLGERAAELAEMPVMLVVSMVAARWVVKRLALPASARVRLGSGGVALALLLAAELTLVLGLRGSSLAEYLASRDPVAGAAYLATLAVYALMPFFVARR